MGKHRCLLTSDVSVSTFLFQLESSVKCDIIFYLLCNCLYVTIPTHTHIFKKNYLLGDTISVSVFTQQGIMEALVALNKVVQTGYLSPIEPYVFKVPLTLLHDPLRVVIRCEVLENDMD